MKGIIVAAGYGTRFLPATKTIPKEMLPIMDKPAISFIVEEFIDSGIKDIIIISSRRKKSMEDFFDREMELEHIFIQEENLKKLSLIRPYENVNISIIRQQDMKGVGHALLQAKPWLDKDQPVVVAYPDDLYFGDIPLTKKLITTYKEKKCSVLATLICNENINDYGVVSFYNKDESFIKSIIEKPPIGTEPSNEISIGRFLYTYDFFDYLEEGWKKHEGKEYHHIYALNKLMHQKKVVSMPITDGVRVDIGTPKGFLDAIMTYASADNELRNMMIEKVKSFK